jgi:hypothetical protein
MLYHDALGWGDLTTGVGAIGLDTVVRASAAFPGAFPPKRIPTKRVIFHQDPMMRSRTDVTPEGALFLADGGVWNNLGTDWWDSRHGDHTIDWRAFVGAVAGRRTRTYAQRNPQIRVIVNSSAPISLKRVTSRFVLPFLAEVCAPGRVVAAVYHNTVAPRVAALTQRTGRLTVNSPETATIRPRSGEYVGTGAYVDAGPVVLQLTDKPRYKWATWLWNERLFGQRHDDPTLQRAFDAINVRREAWSEATRTAGFAAEESCTELGWSRHQAASIPTTLGRMPRELAVNLLRHGYVDAMGGLHVLYGLPLLPIPSRDYFEELLRGTS